jgi:hypothetical protein
MATAAETAALAQLTATGIETPPNYNSFTPSTVGGTFVDPVFGSTIKRVSDALHTPNSSAGSGTLTWIEAEYSTAAAFNSDNSNFILVHESYFGLYDGATGTYLRDLPFEINSSSEPRWSRKDNMTLYYHAGNMFKSYNVGSGAIQIVHTFSEYSSIGGNGEMDISYDGDHFVLVGDNREIFVYQIGNDKKYQAYNTNGMGFDSVYITADNNVIVSWYPAGTVRFTGQELFDINMNFLRQVGHADGHKHLTRDGNGAPVLIWTNSSDPQPIPNCQNGIVKILLSDASQTCLAQLDWSLAVHITAPDGNGSAFVETYAPANPEPGSSGWVPYTNELLQVKLDGSGVTRLTHHRSRPWESYLYMPKATVSRDGTRLLYASNYDLQGIDAYPTNYADTYLITLSASATLPVSTTPPLPTAPVVPTPTPAPTATTTTVRYEQTDPSVQYSGIWYPNSGGFNSGGSAAMAVDAGSEATFRFTGTGVKWIGFSDPWSGIAQVYLDGSLVATIDTFSAAQKAQVVQYSVSSLTNTAHTLAIVATGTKDGESQGGWVWIDAFDVTTSAGTTDANGAVAQPGIVLEDNPAIQYTGAWFPNSGAFNLGGKAALAMGTGSQAKLTFNGTGVTWIGFSDPWSGIAQVQVDGSAVTTVDTYSFLQKAQANEHSIANLNAGIHTLTITVTGTADSQSSGSWVWLNAFNVAP